MASPIRTSGAALPLFSGTITTAGTAIGGTVISIAGVTLAHTQAKLTWGSGGTNATAYIQTSLDNGATWADIACFQFTTSSATRIFSVGSGPGTAQITPTDGSLTANTMVPGVIGDRLRVKLISTGTYAGNTTLAVDAVVKAV